MFCNECGKEFQDDMNFCPYCGVRVNNAQESDKPVDTEKTEREKSLNEINKLLNYFSQKATEYKKHDRVTDILNKLRIGRTGTQKKLSRVFLLISGILFMLFLAIVISQAATHRAYINSLSIIGIICFTFFVQFLIAGIALLIVDSALDKKYINNAEIYSNRYFELTDELYVNYLSYDNCPINEQFTNPNNLFAVQKTLVFGEADSINEAISLLSNNVRCKNIEKRSKQVADFARENATQNRRKKTESAQNAIFLPGNYF